MDHDLIVIGDGAGGRAAARAARRRGATTTLVQHGPLGWRAASKMWRALSTPTMASVA